MIRLSRQFDRLMWFLLCFVVLISFISYNDANDCNNQGENANHDADDRSSSKNIIPP